jgi:hypothetical protein
VFAVRAWYTLGAVISSPVTMVMVDTPSRLGRTTLALTALYALLEKPETLAA